MLSLSLTESNLKHERERDLCQLLYWQSLAVNLRPDENEHCLSLDLARASAAAASAACRHHASAAIRRSASRRSASLEGAWMVRRVGAIST